MPILVRPVREQLEHDRIIRLLEAKWRRKFKVDANPGDERNVGVKVPAGTLFPDLILTEEGGRKPKALVEVETNESVNHLEAMAQWANLAKSKTSLILFVPVGAVEAARRLAGENAIKLTELWTYMVLGDQVRFTSVVREPGAEPADLIEKVEVFTTERAAPAPRPVAVEPAEPAEPPPPAEPERPRKLAVKSGSRRPVDGVAGLVAAKLAAKAGVKAPTSTPPAVVPKVAATKAAPAKVEPVKPVAPAKAAAPVKPVPPVVKAAAPAKVVAPVKAAPPVKVVAPKPAEKAHNKGPEKVAEKPVEKAAVKVAAKPVAKAVAGKPDVKKPVAKAAPVKATPVKATPVKAVPVAKKAAPPKAAARPIARKAVPVRPAARAASPKKAAPAAKSGAAKRK